jgi:4-hydroxymandelate oxidase
MDLVSLYDYEKAARDKLSAEVWDFIAGGVGREVSLRRNCTAFDEVSLVPRFMVDVSERSTSTTVLGKQISFPVMTAPAGTQGRVYPDGDLAMTRAAGSAGTIAVVPMAAEYSLEHLADVASGPLWFQLFHYGNELTEELVTRAEAAGYAAICVTVDTVAGSRKDRDLHNRYVANRDKAFASLAGTPEAAAFTQRRPAVLTWSDLDRLASMTGLPIVIKGIMSPADAVLAAEHGAGGIVVSNHGARSRDGTQSTIEALPAIADAVGDRIEVFLDSGVRRGIDVVRALALGARAVFIGRPGFWGLVVDGEKGVRSVLDILRNEFDLAMASCGKTSPSELSTDVLAL